MRILRFLHSSGVDRLCAGLAVYGVYRVTPAGHGLATWFGCAVILGLVLYAARPD